MLFFPISDRLLNSIKTAIACFFGLCIAKLNIFPMGQWILMTIVVVMGAQIHLGGTLQKSYRRIIGAVLGGLVGGLSYFFFHPYPYVLDGILLFSCLIFSYAAAASTGISDGGILGAVTVIMILMSEKSTFLVAFFRPMEIIVGILIALFVTRYVFPVRATIRLRSKLSESLVLLKQLYEGTMHPEPESHKTYISHPLEEKILESFTAQKKLMGEAKSERFPLEQRSTLYKIMEVERRLYRTILFLNYALHANAEVAGMMFTLPEYEAFNTQVLSVFAYLTQRISRGVHPEIKEPAILSSDALSAALAKALLGKPSEAVTYANAFSVTAALLIDECKGFVEVAKLLPE